MKTWGDSWGECWGDTWGADDTAQAAIPSTSGGSDPRRFTDFTDDDLIQIGVALILSGAFDG